MRILEDSSPRAASQALAQPTIPMGLAEQSGEGSGFAASSSGSPPGELHHPALENRSVELEGFSC